MAYIGKSPTGSGVRQRYVYTATGGETSLSGADDNSKTLKFTDGEYVDVHLNGIQLVQGTDYGVGTANTISSLAALAADDVVEITVYDVYNVAKINSEAMRNRWYYTATGGETSLTTTEISGLSFPANAEIEVRLNGIALVQGTDFNTTTANTVGGLAALSSGNVVEIVYYEAFQLADVVSKAAGGTYNGGVTFSGGATFNSAISGLENTSGLILQVQQDSTTTSESTTQTSNSSQTTSALSVNITPTSTSSKILVLVHLQTYNATNDASTYYNLYRDGTDLTLTGSGNSAIRHFISNGSGVMVGSFAYLDSPATTSQITYDIRYFVSGGTGYISVSQGQSSITVMEIAG